MEDIVKVVNELLKGSLSKITLVATDTCLTNQKVWNILSNRPDTRHIFMVLCNSHSLQLLIKDLLEKILSINKV
jgi:hypothetical protein